MLVSTHMRSFHLVFRLTQITRHNRMPERLKCSIAYTKNRRSRNAFYVTSLGEWKRLKASLRLQITIINANNVRCRSTEAYKRGVYNYSYLHDNNCIKSRDYCGIK